MVFTGFPRPPGTVLPLNLANAGPVPGVLDATQAARILRRNGNTLHFSTFHPLTASPHNVPLNFQDMELEYSQRRIVIEVSGTGSSSWRYVPSASREVGVENEGIWPRVIDICGVLVYCSRDQWDIHKLDPDYECLVRRYPGITAIRKVDVAHENASTHHYGKRCHEDFNGNHYGNEDWNTDILMEGMSEHQEGPEGPDRKRVKVGDLDGEELPRSGGRTHFGKRRDELKQKRWLDEVQARARERDERNFWNAMEDVPSPGADVPPGSHTKFQSDGSNTAANGDIPANQFADLNGDFLQQDDGDYARAASLEESRRKMEELEADRSSRERAAKRRNVREEGFGARANSTGSRHDEQHNIGKNQGGGMLRDDWRRDEVDEDVQQSARRARWRSGEWTATRAFQNFFEASNSFDNTAFSERHHLHSDDVPWPTLQHPHSLTLPGDITWSSVEAFFGFLQSCLSPADVMAVLEKCRVRFHPDRWRSRRLFQAIRDPAQAIFVETAVVTVSQALGAIHGHLKSAGAPT